jgi:hypothetical protein
MVVPSLDLVPSSQEKTPHDLSQDNPSLCTPLETPRVSQKGKQRAKAPKDPSSSQQSSARKRRREEKDDPTKTIRDSTENAQNNEVAPSSPFCADVSDLHPDEFQRRSPDDSQSEIPDPAPINVVSLVNKTPVKEHCHITQPTPSPNEKTRDVICPGCQCSFFGLQGHKVGGRSCLNRKALKAPPPLSPIDQSVPDLQPTVLIMDDLPDLSTDSMPHKYRLFKYIPRGQVARWRQLVHDNLSGFTSMSDDRKINAWRFLLLEARLFLQLPKRGGKRHKSLLNRNVNNKTLRSTSFHDARPPNEKQPPSSRNATKAKACAYGGAYSKAVSALMREETFPVNADTLKTLGTLHPTESFSLPPIHGDHVVDPKLLKYIIREKLTRASAPGWSGITRETLLPILCDKDSCEALTAMIADIVNNKVPSQISPLLMTAKLFPLVTKKNGQVKTRPLVLRETLLKIAEWVGMLKIDVAKLCPAPQYGTQKAGVELAIHKLRDIFRNEATSSKPKDPGDDMCIICLDSRNAFNEMYRSAIFKKIEQTSLNHIKPLFASLYGAQSDLFLFDESGVVHKIKSTRGTHQGGPLSQIYFDATLQDPLNSLALQFPSTFAIHDDVSIICKVSECPSVVALWESLIAPLGLSLQPSKSKIMRLVHRESEPEWQRDLIEKGFQFPVHVTIGGIHFSQLQECHEMDLFLSQVKSYRPFFSEVTALPCMIADRLIRHCCIPLINHVIRCSPPEVTALGTKEFDLAVIDAYCKILNVDSIPFHARTQISTPLKAAGGFGLRSMQDVAPLAYKASYDRAFNVKDAKSQKELTSVLDQSNIDALKSLRPKDIHSLQHPWAKKPFVLPLSDLRLSDYEWRILCYLRLGLPILTGLCSCGSQLNLSHAFTCKAIRSFNKYTRHNMVRDAIVRTCRKYGVTVSSEPWVADGKRADIAVHGLSEIVITDIVVVVPWSDHADECPLEAIHKAARLKCDLYESVASPDWRFVPFALDLFGASHKGADDLFEFIAGQTNDYIGCKQELIAETLAALHRGNAAMTKSCSRRLGSLPPPRHR